MLWYWFSEENVRSIQNHVKLTVMSKITLHLALGGGGVGEGKEVT